MIDDGKTVRMTRAEYDAIVDKVQFDAPIEWPWTGTRNVIVDFPPRIKADGPTE